MQTPKCNNFLYISKHIVQWHKAFIKLIFEICDGIISKSPLNQIFFRTFPVPLIIAGKRITAPININAKSENNLPTCHFCGGIHSPYSLARILVIAGGKQEDI